VLVLRVAAATAVWRVGGRHDPALPVLAWALKDEYWGVSRQAAEVIGEMGGLAHGATPDLVRLADRRLAHGPFRFEDYERAAGAQTGPESLLAVVTTALGRCGRGSSTGGRPTGCRRSWRTPGRRTSEPRPPARCTSSGRRSTDRSL
jgi:hypothetical protein